MTQNAFAAFGYLLKQWSYLWTIPKSMIRITLLSWKLGWHWSLTETDYCCQWLLNVLTSFIPSSLFTFRNGNKYRWKECKASLLVELSWKVELCRPTNHETNTTGFSFFFLSPHPSTLTSSGCVEKPGFAIGITLLSFQNSTQITEVT